jgi:hypothetical protein
MEPGKVYRISYECADIGYGRETGGGQYICRGTLDWTGKVALDPTNGDAAIYLFPDEITGCDLVVDYVPPVIPAGSIGVFTQRSGDAVFLTRSKLLARLVTRFVPTLCCAPVGEGRDAGPIPAGRACACGEANCSHIGPWAAPPAR